MQEKTCQQLCLAWACLGDSYLAEDDHPDADIAEAIRWYTKCTDNDTERVEEYSRRLREAGRKMSGADLDKLLTDIYNINGSRVGKVLGFLLFIVISHSGSQFCANIEVEESMARRKGNDTRFFVFIQFTTGNYELYKYVWWFCCRESGECMDL